jgi:WD40 repeat protein
VGSARRTAIAPDNKLLAVATSAGVALFALPSLEHVRFDAIEGGAQFVAFSPDGQQLAVSIGQTDATIITQVRRVSDATTLLTLAGQEPLFSADGQTIATRQCRGGACHTYLWDSHDGAARGEIEGTEPDFGLAGLAVPAPPPGVQQAISHDRKLLATNDGAKVQLWSLPELLKTPEAPPLRTFVVKDAQPQSWGIAIAFSRDDQLIQAVLGGHLHLWRVADDREVGDVPNMFADAVDFVAGGDVLRIVAAGGDAPATITLVRPLDGKTLYDGQASDISYSYDNSMAAIVAYDKPVEVLDLRSGASAELALPALTSIAFSPDAQTLAASTAKNALLWRVTDGGLQLSTTEDIPGFFDDVHTRRLRYSPDGQTLAFEQEHTNIYSGLSASATIWDIRTADQQARQTESQLIQPGDPNKFVWAFSSDASASAFVYDGRQVELHTASGTTLKLDVPGITALEFSRDGALLAIGDAAGALRLVKASDGSITQTLTAGDVVRLLAFSPDGTLLAALRGDGTTPVWRIGERAPLAQLAADKTDSRLIFTADNQMLIAGGARGVAFYSLDGGQLLHTLAIAADDIAIGPRRRLLALLHAGQVQLWGIG